MPTQTHCRFGTFLKSCAVVTLIAILALMGLYVPNAPAILLPGDEDEDRCAFSIAYFYPSSSQIDAGQSTTLLWQVWVPSGCSVRVDLAGSAEAAGTVSLIGSTTVHPGSTTTYRLTVTSLPQLRQVSVTTTVTVRVYGPPTDWELAFHHAPVHHQDTDSSNAKADFLTRVDYDGNLVATDNWEHLHTAVADLRGAVYYSVVESCTHWFITYGMFHPRDWSDDWGYDEHENDMEGLLAIVRKNGSRYGELEGIVTIAHEHFYSYTPAGSPLTAGFETIDGVLPMQADPVDPTIVRPRTFQEAKGHGLTALPPSWGNFAGGDGVIYFPGTIGEVPTTGNDRDVQYALIDLFAPNGLWERQLQEVHGGGETFAWWGTLWGDKGGGCGGQWFIDCTENSASMPWGWDDVDDPPVYRGAMALDPAHLVDVYFNGLGAFSHVYLRNPYLKRLQELRSLYGAAWTPAGWPGEIDPETLFGKLSTSCFYSPPPPDDLPPDDPPPDDPPPCYPHCGGY